MTENPTPASLSPERKMTTNSQKLNKWELLHHLVF
jgi:hypothetical protein